MVNLVIFWSLSTVVSFLFSSTLVAKYQTSNEPARTWVFIVLGLIASITLFVMHYGTTIPEYSTPSILALLTMFGGTLLVLLGAVVCGLFQGWGFPAFGVALLIGLDAFALLNNAYQIYGYTSLSCIGLGIVSQLVLILIRKKKPQIN